MTYLHLDGGWILMVWLEKRNTEGERKTYRAKRRADEVEEDKECGDESITEGYTCGCKTRRTFINVPRCNDGMCHVK